MTKAEILKKEILRQYRSVRQFAMEMNIPYSTLVTALERGIEGMAYGTVIKMCDKLSLNPVDREVFLRFYYYYQKTADIAADMGLNESTVRTKLNRGRAKLRDFLLREDNHDETEKGGAAWNTICLLYTSPSPRD